MWNSGVQKAIWRGSAEDKVCKHQDHVTGAWKQISKQRRRVYAMTQAWHRLYDIVYGWIETNSKRHVSRRRKFFLLIFLQHMDSDPSMQINCWNRMQKSVLGKYICHKQRLWKRKRRLGIALAGFTPTASRITKIGKMQSAGSQLCRRGWKAQGKGKSTDSPAVEAYGHITYAGCKRIATTLNAAYQSIWRHL